MATNYTINWTDGTLKAPFILTGGTVDTSTTSLALTGKSFVNWGERMQENLIHLLENFASNGIPPTNPTPGQLWYDVTSGHLKLRTYSSTWDIIGSSGGGSFPTDLSAFTNSPGYLTSVAWSIIAGKPTDLSAFTNGPGYLSSVAWSIISGKPTDLSSFTNGPGYVTPATITVNVTAPYLTGNGSSGTPIAASIPNIKSAIFSTLTCGDAASMYNKMVSCGYIGGGTPAPVGIGPT